MKRIITTWFLTCLICLTPIWAMAEEPVEISGYQGLQGLSEGQLGDAELREIAGQGLKASTPEEIVGKNFRIILWDEASVNNNTYLNIAIGYGNKAGNSLSVISK